MVEILYPTPELIPSYYECLKFVASERVYIEMIEAPPLERVVAFQRAHMKMRGPVAYAVDAGRVVGWVDVFPESAPRFKHRGGLGMGMYPEYRGKGLGTRLLMEVLEQCSNFGLEKVELHVYTTNLPAIALYRKCGFVEEGLLRDYRRVDGRSYDCLAMAFFPSK